jgi:hypothetical protein
MSHKDTQIVQPRGRVNNIVVVVEPSADLQGKRIQPRLMAILLHRQSLFTKVCLKR